MLAPAEPPGPTPACGGCQCTDHEQAEARPGYLRPHACSAQRGSHPALARLGCRSQQHARALHNTSLATLGRSRRDRCSRRTRLVSSRQAAPPKQRQLTPSWRDGAAGAAARCVCQIGQMQPRVSATHCMSKTQASWLLQELLGLPCIRRLGACSAHLQKVDIYRHRYWSHSRSSAYAAPTHARSCMPTLFAARCYLRSWVDRSFRYA